MPAESEVGFALFSSTGATGFGPAKYVFGHRARFASPPRSALQPSIHLPPGATAAGSSPGAVQEGAYGIRLACHALGLQIPLDRFVGRVSSNFVAVVPREYGLGREFP
jgi:hypothetical protein